MRFASDYQNRREQRGKPAKVSVYVDVNGERIARAAGIKHITFEELLEMQEMQPAADEDVDGQGIPPSPHLSEESSFGSVFVAPIICGVCVAALVYSVRLFLISRR